MDENSKPTLCTNFLAHTLAAFVFQKLNLKKGYIFCNSVEPHLRNKMECIMLYVNNFNCNMGYKGSLATRCYSPLPQTRAPISYSEPIFGLGEKLSHCLALVMVSKKLLRNKHQCYGSLGEKSFKLLELMKKKVSVLTQPHLLVKA